MKKLILLCMLLALPLLAQNPGQYTSVRSGTSLPSTCDQTKGPIYLLQNDGLYQGVGSPCAWQKVGGSGGGMTGVQTVTTTIQNGVNAAGTTQGVFIPPNYIGTDLFTNPNNRPILDLRRIGDQRGGRLSVLDFGADPSGGYYPTAGMSSGSANIGINSTGFWANPGLRAGQTVCMTGAGAAGADLCGSVVSYSAGTIVSNVTASTTSNNRGAWWGTDSSPAFQAAVNLCASTAQAYSPYGGCEIDVPPGAYILHSQITWPAVNGNLYGAITIRCTGGRAAAKLIWTGADQTAMFYGPAGSVPMDIEGCAFVSADYYSPANNYPTAGRAAVAIQFDGGTQHRIINNRFNDLYAAVKGTSSWDNLVDHNFCYGSYKACIWWYNGGIAPINFTTVSNNEFGYYHLHGLLSEAANQGGSNGNTYVANDFEGTSTDTISDVDINDNWGKFGLNRFETSGSTVVGYQEMFFRGTYNLYEVTFCQGPITITGTDNSLNCGQGATAGLPITDTGGFNKYFADMPRGAITGSGAASATISGGQRTGNYFSAPTFQVLGAGEADNATGSATVRLSSNQSSGVSDSIAEPTASYGSPILPTVANPSTLALGTRIYPVDPGYPPGAPRNNVAFWQCVGTTGATCTYNGTWGGTGGLRATYSFSKWHGESSSQPSGGTSGQGDIVWSTVPSGSNPLIGWSVTAGGTPGTFAPIYAINPASPPAWGTTSPSTGIFTTIATNAATISADGTTPDLIAGVTLSAWYKQTGQVDGTNVTTWTDSSTASPHNLTAGATPPVNKTNIVNSQAVVRFTSSPNTTKMSSASWSMTANDAFAIFFVIQRNIGTTGCDVVQDFNSTNINFNGTTNLRVQNNLGSAGYPSGNMSVANDGHFHVYSIVFTPTSVFGYEDGVQKMGVTGATSFTTWTNGLYINNLTNCQMDLPELFVLDTGVSGLSDASRKLMENYLGAKYNIIRPFGQFNGSGALVAGIDSNGKLTASGASTGDTTVAFSATPIFDASVTNNFKITLTGDVTSPSLINVVPGQPFNFTICQDAVGSHAWIWPANVLGGGVPTATASKCSAQAFIFNGTNLRATGPMIDELGNASVASLTTTDTTHAGLLALKGQTLNPTIPSNVAGWLGPSSAAFTSYVFQFPSTAPAANAVMLLGAPSTNVAPVTYPTLPSCPDTTGNHLNFSSGTFSCGTTSSGSAATTITVANAGTTGTTVNTLTKLTGAPSTAVIAATTDTGGVVGVTSSGAGTTGSATITYAGTATCVFDGATTAGDYVSISATTAGNCHDAGSTYPSSGQVVGRVLSTNAAGGSFTFDIFPAEIRASSGGGNKASITCGATNSFNPAVSTSIYVGGVTCYNDAPNTINANYSSTLIPATGTVTTLCVGGYVSSPGSAENNAFTLQYDQAATAGTGNIQWNVNNPAGVCVTGLSIAVTQGHYLNLKVTPPASYVTAPTGVRVHWSVVIN